MAPLKNMLSNVHLPYRLPRPAGCRVLATRLGPVEIAERGHGAPVLILHGTPGGLGAAEAMSRFLPVDRTRAIMVSRPGYLGTPLSSGATIDEQANLMIAVLDALNIPSASVFCISGGGPCGYRLAVLHPDRITAVVAVSALSGPYSEPAISPMGRLVMHSPLGVALLGWMGRRHPEDLVRNALANEGKLTQAILDAQVRSVCADQQQVVTLRDLALASVDCGDRRNGYRNDMRQFERISSLELEKIRVPVLVVHGDVDTDAPAAHADWACSQVPGCERLTITEGGHLAFYAHSDAPATQQHATNFLLRHTT